MHSNSCCISIWVPVGCALAFLFEIVKEVIKETNTECIKEVGLAEDQKCLIFLRDVWPGPIYRALTHRIQVFDAAIIANKKRIAVHLFTNSLCGRHIDLLIH